MIYGRIPSVDPRDGEGICLARVKSLLVVYFFIPSYSSCCQAKQSSTGQTVYALITYKFPNLSSKAVPDLQAFLKEWGASAIHPLLTFRLNCLTAVPAQWSPSRRPNRPPAPGDHHLHNSPTSSSFDVVIFQGIRCRLSCAAGESMRRPPRSTPAWRPHTAIGSASTRVGPPETTTPPHPPTPPPALIILERFLIRHAAGAAAGSAARDRSPVPTHTPLLGRQWS